ncbi:MAG: hypothetical protein AAF806_00515 [Bacteroidota bacterium]
MKEINYTQSYPIYKANQLLTADSLNASFKYLKTQTEFNRVALVGQGVLCGLNASMSDDDGRKRITVSAGFGLTSDGILIYQNSPLSFRGYRSITSETFKSNFEQALDNVINTNSITYYELTQEGDGNFSEICNVNSQVALVVYAEISDNVNNDDANCIRTSTEGRKESINLRYLLVANSNADNEEEGNTQSANLSLIRLKRYGLSDSVEEKSLFQVEQFSDYNKNYELVCAKNASILKTAFDRSLSLPGWVEADFRNWQSAVNNYINETEDRDIPDLQYLYDYLNDVAWAYNEYLASACESRTTSSNCLKAFEEHCQFLTLDVICGVSSLQPFARHYFKIRSHLSESLGQQNNYIKLYERLKTLVANLPKNSLDALDNLVIPSPFIQNGAIDSVEQKVAITASIGKKSKLEKRPVPYYYKDAVTDNWQIEEMCQAPITSYNSESLKDNYDDYNFLRIEGHIGYSMTEVTKVLNDYRKRYNLPFDITLVKLGGEVLAEGKFEDLETLFNTTLQDWICKLYILSTCLYDQALEVSRPISTPDPTSATPLQLSLFKYYEQGTASEFLYKYISRLIDLDGDGVEEQVFFYTVGALREQTAADRIADGEPIWTKDTYSQANRLFEKIENFYDNAIITVLGTQARNKSLKELEGANLENEISLLVAEAQGLRNLLYDILINSTEKSHRTSIEDLIDKIDLVINTCFEDQYSAIQKEYERRKAEQASSLLFSKFAEKHPGLEHLAGVTKGGTLVLVYTEANNINSLFPLYASKKPNYSEQENIIVGDFTLPYHCCAGGAPSSVIVIDEKPVFEMEKTVFCQSEDTSPTPIFTNPSGGAIIVQESNEERRAIIQSAIIKNGDSYTFDHSVFGDDFDIDQAIILKYIVNSGIAELRIRILEGTQIDFSEIGRTYLYNDNCVLIGVSFEFQNDSAADLRGFYWVVDDKDDLAAFIANRDSYVYPYLFEDNINKNGFNLRLKLDRPQDACAIPANKDIEVITQSDLAIPTLSYILCDDEERSIDIKPKVVGGIFTALAGNPDNSLPVLVRSSNKCAASVYRFSSRDAVRGTYQFRYSINGVESAQAVVINVIEPVQISWEDSGSRNLVLDGDDCKLELVLKNTSVVNDPNIVINDFKFQWSININGSILTFETEGEASLTYRHDLSANEGINEISVSLILAENECFIPFEGETITLIRPEDLTVEDVSVCEGASVAIQPTLPGGTLSFVEREVGSIVVSGNCDASTYQYDAPADLEAFPAAALVVYEINGIRSENIRIEIKEAVKLGLSESRETERQYTFQEEGNSCRLESIIITFDNDSTFSTGIVGKNFAWSVFDADGNELERQQTSGLESFSYAHTFTSESNVNTVFVELAFLGTDCVIPTERVEVTLIRQEDLSLGDIPEEQVICLGTPLTLNPVLKGGTFNLDQVVSTANNCSEGDIFYAFEADDIGEFEITYELNGIVGEQSVNVKVVKNDFTLTTPDTKLPPEATEFDIDISAISPNSSDNSAFNWSINIIKDALGEATTLDFSAASRASIEEVLLAQLSSSDDFNLTIPWEVELVGFTVQLSLTTEICGENTISKDFVYPNRKPPARIAEPPSDSDSIPEALDIVIPLEQVSEEETDERLLSLLNQRRIQYNENLAELAKDKSFARTKTFGLVRTAINAPGDGLKNYEDVSNPLMAIIKRTETVQRRNKYIQLMENLLASFLDKQVFIDQENIAKETRAVLKESVRDIKEANLKPSDFYKAWKGKDLKVKVDAKYKRLLK